MRKDIRLCARNLKVDRAEWHCSSNNRKTLVWKAREPGPNVIRTTLVSGRKRWHLIGAYIPPSDDTGETLNCITQARTTVNNPNLPVILLGDFNGDFDDLREGEPGAARRAETETLFSSMELTSMRQHFRQSKRNIGRHCTWYQRRSDRVEVVKAICDHILLSTRADISNLQIKMPRFVTDHRMLKGDMVLGSTREHRRYVHNRRRNPLQGMPSEQSEADARLEELVKAKTTRGKAMMAGSVRGFLHQLGV